MKMPSQNAFLDVDPTIVEKNLQFTESNFNIPNLTRDEYPSKVVKPSPGFCVKTREVGTGTKIFVNICQTDAIPEPKDVSEEELQEMCLSDDEEAAIDKFRVPLSIGDVHKEVDKKGNEAKAIDVAIHPRFLDKVINGSFYRSFLLAIVFEALANKHGIFTTDERSILHNRKAFGTLQTHRIQQRDVKKQMLVMEKKSLIQELSGETSDKPKPKIEIVSIPPGRKEPQYRLYKEHGKNVLYGQFLLPKVMSAKDLILDIGEDRIILEAPNLDYFLDAYVPVILVPDKTRSVFDLSTKILTVTMPIKSL